MSLNSTEMVRNRNSNQKGRVTLDRAISKLGLGSRVEAQAWIEAGRVKVHGSVETNKARLVNPDTAHIEIDGAKASKSESKIYLFHKPKGVVTTKRDPEGRKTIYDLLPDSLQSFHPVGRLDMHTTGLLLLTNDTRISSYLTDPKNEVPRVYLVGVKGEVIESVVKKMEAGVEDLGELLRAQSAKVLKASGRESLLRLELTEGKNREIRRLCLCLGHEVISLKRTSFGPYELADLEPGKVIEALDFNKLR